MEPSPARGKTTGFWIATTVVVAIVSFGIGNRLAFSQDDVASGASSGIRVRGIGGSPPSTVSDTIDFQQFWALWDLLKTKYYRQPLEERDMLYGAMRGLAASTGDPYTTFFEPSVAEEFTKSLEGKFEGIGAEIGIRDGQLQVIAPLPETPAARAGLQPGDAILSVDATSTEALSVEEAVSIIRGPKGTTVTLTIGRAVTKKDDAGRETRENVISEIPIVRDTIVVKSVSAETLDGNIAVIRISHFNTDTVEEFRKAATAAIENGSKGLVIDLRSNPGGFLDGAADVASEWLGDRTVVTERRRGEIVDEFRGSGSGKLRGMPTVVLVNGGSASASEIVAGALQDYGAATIVGTTTFGKGSVQDLTELQDGTAVKITVAEWLTPNGRFINDIGIEPDIVVEPSEEDIHAQRDTQQLKAVELLTTGQAASL
ncbi:S41 family peptidase [Candidatus Uhrbacteria bacterium]|nr:S41 family peptidase [Candidatus Uhrbacteria bacterium]